MNTRNFITVLATVSLLSTSPGLLASDALPHLFVPDGQLLSRPIQVYVSSTNLDENMNPVLMLIGFDSPQHSGPSGTNIWKPFFVAGGQSWTENVSGQTVSRQGSFLLFDLNDYPLAAYKSTARVTPILNWNEAGTHDSASSTTVVGSPIYLGKSWAAAGWTLLVIGALLAVIYSLCHVKSTEKERLKGVLSLISGPDNYMSLWRTQLVAWTLAVGSMVFFFGVIQLRVPQIPDSLVALMGMSVATGGLSTIAARTQGKNRKPKQPKSEDDEGPDKNHKPEFSDLISSYNADLKLVVLSVPKAQMLFWTGLILILFVAKSLLTGELWNVPWEMVALTGVSQTGYVSDKALHVKSTQ
jgi:hypothetical protein